MTETPASKRGSSICAAAIGEISSVKPLARRHDWKEAVAGQRVQIIKPDPRKIGYLEFGAELICSADQSLVALLGASTAAFVAQEVLQRCFARRLTEGDWLPALRRIIPTWGIDLRVDADACRRIRASSAAVLKLEYAWPGPLRRPND